MLQSQRDTTALCIRHTEAKPVKRRFDHWDEGELREAIMRTDKAAKGGKAPGKTSKAFSHMTPVRAHARAQMEAVIEVLEKNGPMPRAEILKELPEGIKPQLLSNWLGVMRDEGRVACTYGKINYWRAVE